MAFPLIASSGGVIAPNPLYQCIILYLSNAEKLFLLGCGMPSHRLLIFWPYSLLSNLKCYLSVL